MNDFSDISIGAAPLSPKWIKAKESFFFMKWNMIHIKDSICPDVSPIAGLLPNY